MVRPSPVVGVTSVDRSLIADLAEGDQQHYPSLLPPARLTVARPAGH